VTRAEASRMYEAACAEVVRHNARAEIVREQLGILLDERRRLYEDGDRVFRLYQAAVDALHEANREGPPERAR
jgi:hypothetical protein